MAVRFAAMEADSVPGSTWKNKKALVGAVIGRPSRDGRIDGARRWSVCRRWPGFVVATTSTFHHSGAPPLRVPTTWSCAGIGTLDTLAIEGLPGRSAAMRERSMVGGWSIQVAVAVHWVGGGLVNSGTGI